MALSEGRSNDEIRIALPWHSPNSGNLGVGALTVSNIALVRRAASAVGLRPRFTLVGFVDPGVPSYAIGDDVDCLPVTPRSLLPGDAYWRLLSATDVVLDIGGGDSFADIYGLKRFTYLWLTKVMSTARRVPLVLSPQTIGPFTREPYRSLAKVAVRGAQVTIARDPMSFEAARTLAPRGRVLQSVDVAFALPFERRPKPNPGMVDVGLNVSGLLFNGGYRGGNEFGMQVDYAAYTRKLIQALLDAPDTRVHLVCHVTSPNKPADDDQLVADRLAAEFPSLIRAPAFPSPQAAKSYISALDFLVGGRMHACIAAFSSGVPVVPVAYSRKFAGLFGGVLQYAHVVPVTGLSTDDAVAFTMNRLDHRQELAREIQAGNAKVDELLATYTDELMRLFRSAVGHAQ